MLTTLLYKLINKGYTMEHQNYLVTPMIEDFQTGAQEEVTHEELMQWVQDDNYQRHHPDAWFKLVGSDGKKLKVSDYYEEAEQFFIDNPTKHI